MEEITLTTSKESKNQIIKELWKYREVITFLSWKDIVGRYKKTILGILWGIFHQIVSMVIMTFVFGNLANTPVEDGIPYSIMVYASLLQYNFFTSTFSTILNSLVANGHMFKKTYFTSLIINIKHRDIRNLAPVIL